jgi:two-component system, OmpR family, response regulator
VPSSPRHGTLYNVRVLVVEDEARLASALQRGLQAEGFAVDIAGDGLAGLDLARHGEYDAMILDIMLPGLSGYRVVRALRAEGHWLPVLMLSAKDGEHDQADGLDCGADDYLTKPFSPRELAVRVRNLLRRTAEPRYSGTQRIAFGDVVIDPNAREARKGGELLTLTLKELDLLLFFATNPRQVFSRDQLMDRVWGYQSALDTGTVTVHVRRLRTKIEDEPSHPRHLETVFGAGYRFSP